MELDPAEEAEVEEATTALADFFVRAYGAREAVEPSRVVVPADWTVAQLTDALWAIARTVPVPPRRGLLRRAQPSPRLDALYEHAFGWTLGSAFVRRFEHLGWDVDAAPDGTLQPAVVGFHGGGTMPVRSIARRHLERARAGRTTRLELEGVVEFHLSVV